MTRESNEAIKMENLLGFLLPVLASLLFLSSDAAPARNGHISTDQRHIHAKEWLMKYGYLHDSEEVTSFDQKLALMNMQQFHGLPVTGVISDEDFRVMKAPRCGFPDMVGENEIWGEGEGEDETISKVGQRYRRYSVNRNRLRWPSNSLTYRFINYTSDLSTSKQDSELSKAAAKWSAVSALTISRSPTASASIDLSFHRRTHGDQFVFDGPNGVVAHAFFPGQGIGGDIHFDDDEFFTAGSGGVDFTYITLHEMGHSLGLEHSSNPNAVMSTTFVLSPTATTISLHADDIAGIQFLYGPPEGGTVLTGEEEDPSTPVVCNKVYDAISDVGDTYFLFSGSQLIQAVDRNNGEPFASLAQTVSFPELFLDGPASADAAYVSDESMLTLFSGNRYWRYNFRDFVMDSSTPSFISDFGVDTQSVDAAVPISSLRVIYLFKGNFYWEYSTDTRRASGRLSIQGTWPQVRVSASSPLTSVFYRRANGLIYFVSGTTYWTYTTQRTYVGSGNLNEDITQEICRFCNAIDPAGSGALLLPSKLAAIVGCVVLNLLLNNF